MITVETIRERHSVREYDGGPLDQAEFGALGAVVEECARESGLDIQLVCDNPEVFNVIARFGLIRGCRTHVAFVVDDAKARGVAADEAIGYWGQKIVLAAQDMGLNTCWCALCSRKKSHAVVAPGKKIRLIIAVGHGKTQGFSRKTKSVEALSFVECVKAPPTAMNNQNFKITLLSDGKTVRIDAPKSGLNVIDEGIVRCNFEIAANEAGADWRWERDI